MILSPNLLVVVQVDEETNKTQEIKSRGNGISLLLHWQTWLIMSVKFDWYNIYLLT